MTAKVVFYIPIDVPLSVAVAVGESIPHDMISVPGARMSTTALCSASRRPKGSKPGEELTAAIVRALGCRPNSNTVVDAYRSDSNSLRNSGRGCGSC